MEFSTYTNTDKKYQWDLKDIKGNIIAKSAIGYNSETDVITAIDLMIKNKKQYRGNSTQRPDPDDKNIEKWYWELRHDNGAIVAVSPQGYKDKSEAQKGITTLMNIITYKITSK